MRKNWWYFGFWYFGDNWQKPSWKLVYDLRCWMFGWEYYFGGLGISVGPLRLEKITTGPLSPNKPA